MTDTRPTPPSTPSTDVDTAAAGSPPAKAPFSGSDPDTWIRDFYKECGREATLAYTTLNQMKNWAITVQGAIIASVTAFNRAVAQPGETASVTLAFPVAIGAALAYIFTLRFFVRAILCYNNLQRWNTLQSTILEAKLLARDPKPGHALATDQERLERLRQNIQDYFYRWRSPIDRTRQLASNLKLGFGILMALPPIFLAWSATVAWDSSLVKALVTFAVGATAIEGEDFFTSPFFDTATAKERIDHDIFPAAGSDAAYIARWIFVGTLTLLIALWPWLSVIISGTGPLPAPK